MFLLDILDVFSDCQKLPKIPTVSIRSRVSVQIEIERASSLDGEGGTTWKEDFLITEEVAKRRSTLTALDPVAG